MTPSVVRDNEGDTTGDGRRLMTLSLRMRVAIAAATGALLIVVALALFLSFALERNNANYLDRQLDTASSLVGLNIDVVHSDLGRVGDLGAFAMTLRADNTLLASTPTRIPTLPPGRHTVDLDNTEYRVVVTTARLVDGRIATVAVAAPTANARTVTRTQQQRVWLTGAAAVAAASALGWLLGGRAVRPLAELTSDVAGSGRYGHSDSAPSPAERLAERRTGSRETDDLRAAINSLFERIGQARTDTLAALSSARSFAANAAHELRTPLTAMRTDLEVVSSERIPEPERAAVFVDLLATQDRIERTLQALEDLAAGDLHTEAGEPIDILELADEAAAEAIHRHPGVRCEVLGSDPISITGWGPGIRIALDNAISNAIRHGQADRIEISAHRNTLPDGSHSVTVSIDDNGTGVPEADRTRVFDRFARGNATTATGSGLGLALVAQQTRLHGGSHRLLDSPLGGVRLELTLATTMPSPATRPAQAVGTDHAVGAKKSRSSSATSPRSPS